MATKDDKFFFDMVLSTLLLGGGQPNRTDLEVQATLIAGALRDLHRAANALERIAAAIEAPADSGGAS